MGIKNQSTYTFLQILADKHDKADLKDSLLVVMELPAENVNIAECTINLQKVDEVLKNIA